MLPLFSQKSFGTAHRRRRFLGKGEDQSLS